MKIPTLDKIERFHIAASVRYVGYFMILGIVILPGFILIIVVGKYQALSFDLVKIESLSYLTDILFLIVSSLLLLTLSKFIENDETKFSKFYDKQPGLTRVAMIFVAIFKAISIFEVSSLSLEGFR